MKFISKLQKFMYGRYGVDELYKFLFSICFILLILNLFIKNNIFFYAQTILFIIIFYRVLSKNIYKRSKENQLFLKIKRNVFRLFKKKDRTFIYKKCKKCKTILKLRLPKKRGINHSICPTCQKRITIISFRKQKVQIYKNKKEV